MLAQKESPLPNRKEIKPINGTETQAFYTADLDEETKQRILRAKAPEHTKQFNNECD